MYKETCPFCGESFNILSDNRHSYHSYCLNCLKEFSKYEEMTQVTRFKIPEIEIEYKG